MARQIWNEESHTTAGAGAANEWNAALQLLIATGGEAAFKNRITELAASNLSSAQMASNGWKAVTILPYMDEAFKSQMETGVRAYLTTLNTQLAANPFGVPSTNGMWGGSQGVADMGVRMYFLHKAFPDIVSSDYTIRAANYILGTHPYTNTSWVSGVGTKSTELAYGSNRADNSYINGGMVPGYVNIAPDFPEALDDFQYLWFENEYTINATSKWILLGNAASEITSHSSFDGTFMMMADGKTIRAFIPDDASADLLTLIVATYDEKGRLVEAQTTSAPFSDYRAGVTASLQGDTEGKTIKAYLWDAKFAPYCAPAVW